MIELALTERDVELIEIALEAAASACAGFPGRGEDPLQREYLDALSRVQDGRT